MEHLLRYDLSNFNRMALYQYMLQFVNHHQPLMHVDDERYGSRNMVQ
jgi:hypothetical protein